jgi:hypothetical protein
MSVSHQQNTGQNCEIKMASRCFVNVVQFEYLGTTLRDQNYIDEEIKSRLNSGNAATTQIRIFSLLVYCLKM